MITRGLGGGLRRILRGAGLGKPRWPARWRASFIAQSWAPLLDESTALSGPGLQRAQPRATTQRARTLGIAAGSDHIGNLKSTVLLAVLPALRHGGTNPRGEYCPVPDSGRRCARVWTSSAPLRCPTQPNRTHARTQPPRRTLSFTIASQTIASSPDGSEISSAASSACGTPAATVGGCCRFRASSTVTSSSSPCNDTLCHSAASASEQEGRRALPTAAAQSSLRSAILAAHCPVRTEIAVNVNPKP
jgi:hypothetical protein